MPIITDRYIVISKDQLAQVFTEWAKRVAANPGGGRRCGSPEDTGAASAEYVVELTTELFPSGSDIDRDACYDALGIKKFDPSIFTGTGSTVMSPELANVQVYNAAEPGAAEHVQFETGTDSGPNE